MKECKRNKKPISQSRCRIHNTILSHPGLHLREISRMLEISKTTINYHLRQLEKQGLIYHKTYGKYYRYYSLEIGSKEAMILSFLRKKTSRDIILFFLAHPYASQADISKSLDKHPTTVEFYLKKLLLKEIIKPVSVINGKIFREFKPTIIDCDPVSNERFFVLSDPILTQNVIKKYKQVLLNDEGSLSMFDCIEFMFTKDIPDKAVNPKKLIDIVLDALFDIFPPPYL